MRKPCFLPPGLALGLICSTMMKMMALMMKRERELIFLAHASTQVSTRVELRIRINLSHQDNHEGRSVVVEIVVAAVITL